MIIFSHRGLGFNIEENSLESYQKALKSGFSLEMDVQASKDGQLIISHDPDLKRLKDINIKITEMNYAELKNLNIPLFDEVLKIFKKTSKPGELLAIHVKDGRQRGLLELLAKSLNEFSIEKECFVFDLTFNEARKLKKLNKNIKIGISVAEKNYWRTIYTSEQIKKLDFMDIIWLDEWANGLYSENVFSKLKKLKKPIYVISPELHRVHDHPLSGNLTAIRKLWTNLINWGADGICTDYPLELSQIIIK